MEEEKPGVERADWPTRAAGLIFLILGLATTAYYWVAMLLDARWFFGANPRVLEDILGSLGLSEEFFGEDPGMLILTGTMAGGHLLFLTFAVVRCAQRVPLMLCAGWGLAVGPGLAIHILMNLIGALNGLPGSVADWIRISIVLGLWAAFTLMGLATWLPTRQNGWGLMKGLAWVTGVCSVPGLLAVSMQMWSGNTFSYFGTGVLTSSIFGLFVLTLLALKASQGRYLRQLAALGLANGCAACGYDLTGTLAAGLPKCPECGREAMQVQLDRWKERGAGV
jgi:hypothetical protein